MRLNDLLNRDNLRSDSMFQASHQNNSNENSKNNKKTKMIILIQCKEKLKLLVRKSRNK